MSERKQDLHKQVIGNMLSCSKPRVALRMILRVYRSVFASTLVLTAISTVIAIALCAVTQPGNWDHLHRGHLLIAQTSVASVTTGMRRVPLIAWFPSLLWLVCEMAYNLMGRRPPQNRVVLEDFYTSAAVT